MTILQAPWGETTHSAETKPTIPMIVWGLPEWVLWLVVVNETDGRCRLLTLDGIWSKSWFLIKLIVYHRTGELFLGRGVEDKLFSQPAAPTLDRMERRHHGACWNDKTSGVWCKVSHTLELKKGGGCWIVPQNQQSLGVWEHRVILGFKTTNRVIDIFVMRWLFMPNIYIHMSVCVCVLYIYKSSCCAVSKCPAASGDWGILLLK